MVICKDCGAEFDEKEIVCPYCGSELMKEAAQEHEYGIRQIRQKTQELQKKPEQYARKTTSVLTKVLLAAVGVFLLVLICLAVFHAVTPDRSADKIRNNQAKLEEFFQAGDYEAMGAYLEKIEDSYSASYRKYFNVVQMLDLLETAIDSCENQIYYAPLVTPGTITVEDVAYSLTHAFAVLADIEEYEEAGFVYGEEAALLPIREQMMTELTERMELTEEEIADGVARLREARAGGYYDSDTKLDDLAELSMNRFM